MQRAKPHKSDVGNESGGVSFVETRMLSADEVRLLADRTAEEASRLARANILGSVSGTAVGGKRSNALKKLLARLKKGMGAPSHFTAVYARALEVLGSSEKAMRWLGQPLAALDYATPISLLEHAEGRDAVLNILGRLEHGVCRGKAGGQGGRTSDSSRFRDQEVPG